MPRPSLDSFMGTSTTSSGRPDLGSFVSHGTQTAIQWNTQQPPSQFQTSTPATTTLENPITQVPRAIYSGAESVAQHPVTAVGGAAVGAVNFLLGVGSSVSSLIGQPKAADFFQQHKQGIEDIFNSNLKDKSQQLSGAVGQFVGSQIPFMLGAEALAPLGEAGAVSLLSKFGGSLPISTVSKIGQLTRLASNAAGFIGIDQLTHTPEEGTRMDAVKRDLLTLGVLEGVGAGLKGIVNSSRLSAIRSYLEEVKANKLALPELETKTAQIMNEVKTETGKTPQELVGQAVGGGAETPTAPPTAPTAPPEISPIPMTPEQPATTPDIQPKLDTVKVPRSQLPVGTGETLTSGLETRIKNNLESAPEDVKSSISTYQQMNNGEQIAQAAKYVTENPEDALKVLQGEKPAPKGLLHNSIYVAMTENANTNSELAAKLASLRSTRYGQEIQILKEINKDNPVKFMSDLVSSKVEALGGREKLAGLRDAEVGKIQKEISIPRLQKTDWNAFVESIKC